MRLKILENLTDKYEVLKTQCTLTIKLSELYIGMLHVNYLIQILNLLASNRQVLVRIVLSTHSFLLSHTPLHFRTSDQMN